MKSIIQEIKHDKTTKHTIRKYDKKARQEEDNKQYYNMTSKQHDETTRRLEYNNPSRQDNNTAIRNEYMTHIP